MLTALQRKLRAKYEPAPARQPWPSSFWSVVATIRAPQWMVGQFVQHYVKAGAKEILLFFDDPDVTKFKPHDRIRPHPADSSLRANYRVNKLVVLHFEGMTFDLFKEKVARRSSGAVKLDFAQGRFEARRAYTWNIYESGGEPALLEFYKKLYVLDPAALKRGLSRGYIEQRTIASKKPSTPAL